ncbi:armadillo-type protein, partial [Hyaloraphidium curvatum]
MADEQEDFSKLPLDELLGHKVWRARSTGYGQLADAFRRLDADDANGYRKHADAVRKAVADANAVAQEAGLAAAVSFLEFGPPAVTGKTRKEVVGVLIDKCFASPRTGTRTKAIDLVLLYLEVEAVDGMVEDLLKGSENKNPKTAACAVLCLCEGLKAFGPKIVEVKPVLKQLPALFGHNDKLVREEAFKLTVELYRWLGTALNPSLESLKPVQVKELQDAFAALPPGRAAATRLLRSQQAKGEALAPQGAGAEGGPADAPAAVVEEPAIDPLDLLEEVAVLDKIPGDFYSKLGSPKWQERKEAMESLLEVLKAPKMADGRYHELVGGLGKHIGDVNLFVVTLAANAIERLARGLRTAFGHYKSAVVGPMLEKLKEKKPTVVEALAAALDAVFASVTFAEIVEDLASASAHKTPQVRCESIKWLVRCLRTARKPPGKAEIKALGEMLMRTIEDPANEVREVSAEALGTMLRLVGERAMMAFMDRLKEDKIRDAKVREFAERAEVKAAGAAPAPQASSSGGAAPSRGAPSREATSYGSASRNVVLKPSAVKKPAPAKPATASTSSAAAAPAKPKTAPKAAVVEEAPISFKWSDEAAEEAAAELLEAATITNLADTNWKVRLEALNAGFEKIKAKDPAELDTEMLARLLLRKPSWKENNFQVLTVMINALQHLARAPGFGKGTASLVLPGLVEKLNDAKQKKVASDCMTAVAEGTSLQFVLSQIYEPIKAIKLPKAYQEALMWINSALLDFGIEGLVVRDLIECVKLGLGNSNQLVRTAAVAIIGTLATFMGQDVRGSFQDMSAALLSSIDVELTRVSGRSAPKPSKTQKLLAKKGAAEGPAAVDDAGSSALDDLFPRVDLSTLVTEELLAELGDVNWKVRKEALDKVAGMLQTANNRIKPNLGDLVPALKERFSDSNKNLVIQTLDLVGNLALATGKPFDRTAKILAPPMCSCLTDNKPQVRASATAALDKICNATSFEVLTSACEGGLAIDNPSLRKDLLTWIAGKLPELKAKAEAVPSLPSLVLPALMCTQDKNLDVRKAAQSVIPQLVDILGYDVVHDKAAEAKGPTSQTLVQIVDSYKPARAVATPPSVPGGSTPRKGLPAPSANKSALLAAGAKRKIAPATPAAPEPSQTADAVPPLLTSDPHAKKDRADKDRGVMKWQFDAPRKDLVDFLEEQTEGNFSEAIRALMFREDHNKDRDHLRAVTVLEECVTNCGSSLEEYGIEPAEMAARIVANTDLILKYVTIRLFDTNTIMLLKLISLLDQLFALLGDQDGFRLSEYEATSFLPFLVTKLGDSKESVRAQIRQLFSRICMVYPVSKLFPHILEGIRSKSSRVRSECLEELTSMIKRNGLSVCSPPRIMPLIALQIADRDAAVRNGALNFLAQAVQLENGNKEKVFQYIGKISDKDRSLLEERLKRMPSGPVSLMGRTEAAAPLSSGSGSSPATPSRSAQPASAEPGMGSRTISEESMPTSGKISRVFSLDFDDNAESPVDGPRGAGNRIELALAKVEREDVEAFRELNNLYKTSVDAIIASLHDIIASVSVTLSRSTDTRFASECINTLILFFSNSRIIRAVDTQSLVILLPEALRRMQDTTLYSEEERAVAVKALNQLMGKVLENVDKTRCFTALLTLLRDRCTILQQNLDTMPDAEKTRLTGVLELVMKCLWKLTKQVPQLIESRSVDLKELLHQIHETLKQIPPSEYKKSANRYPNKDLPVRTVKTLLSELTGCLGTNIFAYIDPEDLNESNIVMNYVQQALEAKKKKGQPGDASEDSIRSMAAPALEPVPPASLGARHADSAKVLSTSATAEQLAQDLQSLKISINSSELPVDASLSTLPSSYQNRILSQVSAASSQPTTQSESERRQEKFLELKRLMV